MKTKLFTNYLRCEQHCFRAYQFPSVVIFFFLFIFLTMSCSQSDIEPINVADSLTAAKLANGSYISWKEHIIDDEEASGIPLRGADGLKMADLDKDGHPDVVSVHEDSFHVRIAYGTGNPEQWVLQTLAEGTEVQGAEDVSIGDLNRDGYPDIIVACEREHLIYFQNPGDPVRESRWERVIPKITTNRGSFIRVFFADINADGNLEVVATNKGTGPAESISSKPPKREISWFETGTNPLDGDSWKEHVLKRLVWPINSQPVDLDGDGDIDVVGGSMPQGEWRIFWFENLGKEKLSFREHAIEIALPSAPQTIIDPHVTGFNMAYCDLNDDGRLDILLSAYGTPYEALGSDLVWIEQPCKPYNPWILHSVGTIAPDQIAGITVADVNGDSSPDVIVGSYSRGPRLEDGEEVTASDRVGHIAWFANPGKENQDWICHNIVRRKRGMFDAFVARDMDGDGDMDCVATRGNSGNYDGVFWLEQVHTSSQVKVFQPARVKESMNLTLPPN
ncbi:FG-GAP repeat domain-containing protein [Acidobacteriota bacterium]